MFFFKYLKNKKNYILFYNIIAFFILIYLNQNTNTVLRIAKVSSYMISISLFLTIIFSYEFITFSERINFHKLFSKFVIVYVLLHTISHIYIIISNIILYNKNILFYFSKSIYITGIILFFLLLIIVIFSLKSIRKNFFNIFYFSHMFLYVFVIICIFHSNYYVVFLVMLIIKPLYFILFKNVKIEKNEIVLLTSNFVLIKIYFKNKNKIKNGDCIYLKCMNISKFEKHPFTVIDSSFGEEIQEENSLICAFTDNKVSNYITICISNNGDWKGKLISYLNKNLNYDLHNNGIKLKICGYYNTNISYLKNYDTIIFFCENIGITSFLSFLYFIKKKKNQNKIYNIVLNLQIDNTNIIKLLENHIFFLKEIKCLNIIFNIYIRNEEIFNIFNNNIFNIFNIFNLFKNKINYENIIKNLENNKTYCIYHCGNSKDLFKIKYFLYNLKKKHIALYYL